jgi:hypothetical protein
MYSFAHGSIIKPVSHAKALVLMPISSCFLLHAMPAVIHCCGILVGYYNIIVPGVSWPVFHISGR